MDFFLAQPRPFNGLNYVTLAEDAQIAHSWLLSRVYLSVLTLLWVLVVVDGDGDFVVDGDGDVNFDFDVRILDCLSTLCLGLLCFWQ